MVIGLLNMFTFIITLVYFKFYYSLNIDYANIILDCPQKRFSCKKYNFCFLLRKKMEYVQ